MSNGAELPLVSVIVPVYNDWSRLDRCLTALNAQSYPAECFEILVVDNGSDIPPPPFPSDSRIKLVRTERVGSFAARNDGVKQARGELLAFTDADCLPDAHWLSEGVKCCMAMPSFGSVAGRIAMSYKVARAPSVLERYDGLTGLRQDLFVTEQHFGATANLFISKEVFLKVGYFDEHFLSAGDKEWGNRAYLQGYRHTYCPAAVIAHPCRDSLGAILSRGFRITCDRSECSERFPQLQRSNFQRAFHHLVTRPLRLWRESAELGEPMQHRVAVVALYYGIKILQAGERIRVLLGGKYRR